MWDHAERIGQGSCVVTGKMRDFRILGSDRFGATYITAARDCQFDSLFLVHVTNARTVGKSPQRSDTKTATRGLWVAVLIW